jgi:hypothetical protein
MAATQRLTYAATNPKNSWMYFDPTTCVGFSADLNFIARFDPCGRLMFWGRGFAGCSGVTRGRDLLTLSSSIKGVPTSRLAEFRVLELAAQLAASESLRSDSGLKRKSEFDTKLRNLLAVYSLA